MPEKNPLAWVAERDANARLCILLARVHALAVDAKTCLEMEPPKPDFATSLSADIIKLTKDFGR